MGRVAYLGKQKVVVIPFGNDGTLLLGHVFDAVTSDYIRFHFPEQDCMRIMYAAQHLVVGNVAGVLKYFTTGTVTNTAPYSLVTTERANVAVQVTLEDSKLTSEKFEGGFQFAFDQGGTTNRIYCMDVLKDAIEIIKSVCV
jgi:hypothetical protein